jgi:hypothetical protein
MTYLEGGIEFTTTPVAVATIPAPAGSQYGGAHFADAVTRLSDGTIAVAYGTLTPNYAGSVFVQLFNRDGSATGPRVVVYSGEGAGAVSPRITALESGGFAVTFNGSGQETISARFYDAVGQPTSSVVVLGSYYGNGEHLSAIAPNGSGAVLAWVNDSNVFLASLADDGTVLHETAIATSVSGRDWDGRLLDLGDGEYAFAWGSFPNQPQSLMRIDLDPVTGFSQAGPIVNLGFNGNAASPDYSPAR